MKLEVQWLAHLATQEGVLDSAKCLILKHALGKETDLLAFGEKLIDLDYCTDIDQLQRLIEDAQSKSIAGAPVPNDPFEILQTTSNRTFGKRSIESTSAPIVSKKISLSPQNPSASISSARPSIPSMRKWTPSHNRTGYSRASIPEQSTPPIEQSNLNDRPGLSIAPKALQPTPAKAAPTPVQTSTEVIQPEPGLQLSKERPAVSLEVEDSWPDFEAVKNFTEVEARQCMVQLLLKSRAEGASDLHLSAVARPFVRRNRMVVYLGDYILTEEDSRLLNLALLSEFQKHAFGKNHELDFALSLQLHLRYRVNLMEHKDGFSGTYRLVPNEIKSLEALGFGEPETIKKLLTYHNGLIMVTGPLGSGKTTTLAALVNELNHNRQDHLISVESPIEIVQHSHQCQITQREVGSHTKTFHSALKGALRQDPDIIVFGEMRDMETVEMALSASETGHLVIGTMHTSDAANTLNRLLDVFPAAQQTQIRAMVAESLKGIICQRLLPSTNGGVELAYELLINNAAVGNLIRTNKADGLSNIIETGRREGMVLMDKSIFALWEADRISDEVALANLISLPMRERINEGRRAEVEI